MASKVSLLAERSVLIDAKFLHGLTSPQAARLAEIDLELERREAPKVARLNQRLDRERTAIDKQIAAFKAKIAESAPDSPKARSARIP